MDCHRCVHLKYSGCPYGRCTHPGHLDVVFVPKSKRSGEAEGKRPYSREICPDFKLRKKCSNCKHWKRGEYFADGMTPAKKGGCSLRLKECGPDCPLWKQGPTSWKKKRTTT